MDDLAWSPGKLTLLAITGLVVLLGIGTGLYRAGQASAQQFVVKAPLPAQMASQSPLRVHITGAVKRPGVYSIRADDRVIDAIARAGGALPGARLHDLNLAAQLTDGLRLYIPGPGDGPRDEVIVATEEIWIREPPAARPATSGAAPPAPQVTDVGTLTVSQRPASSSDSGGERKPLPAAAVNLNTATVAQLETLPGIGPVMARRILAYRETHGRFGSPQDLLAVKGIGEKTLAKLLPYLSTD
ncbi:MAG: ComEA family DNA-binding protein [Fimbriimonadaceae bacterium]|nr:ComEA family DNA-binding protein [Fimbriimonadaceae bacterium]